MRHIFDQDFVGVDHVREPTSGIRAITVLFTVAAIVCCVYALLIGTGTAPFSRGAWLLGSDFAIMGPVAFMLAAFAYGSSAFLVWRMMRFGWWIALAVLLVGFVQEIPTISLAVGDGRYFSMFLSGVRIILRVAMASYLTREDVRELFRGP